MSLVAPELAERVIARALARGGDLGRAVRRGPARLRAVARRRPRRASAGRPRGGRLRARGEGRGDLLRPRRRPRRGGAAAGGRLGGQAVRGDAREPAGAARPPSAPAAHPSSGAPEEVPGRAQGRPAARLRRARPRRGRRGRAGARRLRGGAGAWRSSTPTGFAAADDRTRMRLERPGGGPPRRPRGDRHRHPRRPRRLRAPGRGRPRRWPERPRARRSRCSTPSTRPTGRMPVVVGNGFGGVLLHEAVGHGLEADAVQKRASVYAGRLGDQLAGRRDAYDDGALPNEWGSDGIDDEGTPTQRTTVIEDGKLVSYLYDLMRARKRRRGVDRQRPPRVLPPPAVAAHDQHLLRARRRHPRGPDRRRRARPLRGLVRRRAGRAGHRRLRVRRLRGLPDRGRQGHRARARRDAGRQRDRGAGGDRRHRRRPGIATGYCGKAGQRVAAGVGQPHVHIRELTVGGTA